MGQTFTVLNPIRHGISKLQLDMGGGYYSPDQLKSILLPKYRVRQANYTHTFRVSF